MTRISPLSTRQPESRLESEGWPAPMRPFAEEIDEIACNGGYVVLALIAERVSGR